jgi:hypothetical protein
MKVIFLQGEFSSILTKCPSRVILSVKFRFVFWDVLPCKIIVDRRFRGTCCLHHQGDESLIARMIEAARTSETSIDNYFTRQYIPEDKSELHTHRR